MNWYSKRITLAGVYKSSELYMVSTMSDRKLTSSKEDINLTMADTRQFVDRRLEDVMSFGKLTAKVSVEENDIIIVNTLICSFELPL